MADEQIVSATDATSADTSTEPAKKKRAPRRSKTEMEQAAAAKAAKSTRGKVSQAATNPTGKSSVTETSGGGAVKNVGETGRVQTGGVTQKGASTSAEFFDLMKLEEENAGLRKALAEKLRAENADLRKRLGAE